MSDSLTSLDSGTKSVRDKSWVDKKLPQKSVDTNYLNINNPFTASGDRKVDPFFGNNYYQNEGEGVIKTGDSITDIWVNTWIKSKNHAPSTRGFMLDAKKGLIEAENISSGWGITMNGNDATFYDRSVGGNGAVTGDVATLNFTRLNYPDQTFTIRKRVGFNSISESKSDNVMDFFFPNPAQTESKNYIFIGKGGSSTYPDTYNTDYIALSANDNFGIQVGVENQQDKYSSSSFLIVRRNSIIDFTTKTNLDPGGDPTANIVDLHAFIGEKKTGSADGGGYLKIGVSDVLINPITGKEQTAITTGFIIDKDNINAQIGSTQFDMIAGAFDPTKKYLREV